jgi:hypothetical protein
MAGKNLKMMMPTTFITSGETYPIFSEQGDVVAYKVGREGKGSIHLTKTISEYNEPGHRIVIDAWGSPWVKK